MAYSSDLIPTMTSNTEPSGTASASTELVASYAAWKAMNDDALVDNDCWATTLAAGGVGWLRYQWASGQTITQYTVRAEKNDANPPESANRAPNTWTFQGSNDGSEWTTLDTQSGITWTHGETKTYPVTNSTSYTYYQINVSANNGDGYLTIGEIQMMSGSANGGGGEQAKVIYEGGTPTGLKTILI